MLCASSQVSLYKLSLKNHFRNPVLLLNQFHLTKRHSQNLRNHKANFMYYSNYCYLIYMYISTHMSCAYICMYLYKHVCMYMCTYTHTYMYVYTYIHAIKTYIFFPNPKTILTEDLVLGSYQINTYLSKKHLPG